MSIECISIWAPLGGTPMNVADVASAVGVPADELLARVDDVIDLDAEIFKRG